MRGFLVIAISFFIFSISSASASRQLQTSIADVLRANCLPVGILPTSPVREFSILANGSFHLRLQRFCMSEMEETLFFGDSINGTISHEKVENLYGVWVQKGYSWSPVTRMEVEMDTSKKGHIVFQVGFSNVLSFPVSVFRSPVLCESGTDFGYRTGNNNYTGYFMMEDEYYTAPRRAAVG